MARSVYYFTDSRELGGAEQALLQLIESIDGSAWSPTLLYNPSPPVEPLAQRARRLGAELWCVPPMPFGLEGARRVPALVRQLRRERPAVFHAHLSWPLAAKYPLAAAVLARVPAVVATVQLFPAFRFDRSTYLQERLLAACIGQYIAVSHDIATRLNTTLGWPARKITVIPNSVAVEDFARPVDPDLRRCLTGGSERPVILTVARLAPQKGLDVLLRSAAQVPEARFVVAGSGPERARLEGQAAALGLGDRALFLGHRDDVADLLAACDVFVLPSLYEGLPVALLEAMAAAKPVVSSAIGGTAELVVEGESGILVPPGDADALAFALRRLLADRQLAEGLAAAGRRRVARRFSSSAMAERVIRVYDDLLTAGVGHRR